MLTLGIVPVVYSLLDDLRQRFWKTSRMEGRDEPSGPHALPSDVEDEPRSVG